MWEFFTKIKIEYFQSYLQLIRESIEGDLEKLDGENQRMLREGAERIETEDGHYYDPYETLADQAFQLSEYEQLMLSTFVIGVFVFMEEQFNDICRLVKKENKVIFSYKDLKGFGVGRSLNYLEKVLSKNPLSDQTTRSDFEIAQIIRNSLVHADGHIDEDKRPRISAYIEQYPNQVKLDHYNKIEITCDYAEALIALTSKINAELGNYAPKSYF